MAKKPTLRIDGARFHDHAGFMEEVSRLLQPDVSWGRNLDAFNDILRGGFGTPEGGFVLEWLHSDVSREALGFPETVRWLEEKLRRCHPANVSDVQADLQAAKEGRGQTLFEILVDIIRAHGPGGDEAEDGVVLVLK